MTSRRTTITLEQIKKNARRLEKDNALLSHKDALDLAAKEQGFPSFFAARQAINRSESGDPTGYFLKHLTLAEIRLAVQAVDVALNESRKGPRNISLERFLSPDSADRFLDSLNREKMVELVALYWLGREDLTEPFGSDYDVPAYYEKLKGNVLRMGDPDRLGNYMSGRWAYFGCFLMRALELLCGDTLIADISPSSAELYASRFVRHRDPDAEDALID